MGTKITRIAEISKANPKEIFTSIYHLINKELLEECHKELDGKKAIGLDGVTKEEYEANLEENITKLETKLKNKAYIPTPAKRVYIPKASGKMRGLAIAIYEDKIVQLALKKVIEAIYEPKFLNCMYGFRPNKSCHDALKDLNWNIEKRKVSYIIDADIKGFFDNVDHEWLIKCLEQHIKDPNIIRLVKRFLKAGIIEEGKYHTATEGTPQGSILSPVLANIYMHYVLALWFEKVIKKDFKGECYITIYADDYICCFQHRYEAELFFNQLLPERLKKFNLELEPDKTRLIEFGRFAQENCRNGKPNTFDFLGFTHYCSKSREGKFRVKRKTSRKKFTAKVKEMKIWIKENRHTKIEIMVKKINEKLRGHYRYFGVTDNIRMMENYLYETRRILHKWLNRRSNRTSYTFDTFAQMIETAYPLLLPKIYVNIYDI